MRDFLYGTAVILSVVLLLQRVRVILWIRGVGAGLRTGVGYLLVASAIATYMRLLGLVEKLLGPIAACAAVFVSLMVAWWAESRWAWRKRHETPELPRDLDAVLSGADDGMFLKSLLAGSEKSAPDTESRRTRARTVSAQSFIRRDE